MPVFEGFSQRTVDFMWNLRLNNNKPWFEAHKEEYRSELLAPMKALGAAVFERVQENSGDRGFIHKVSRIYKDARRNRGDGPYRDHLWFSIERPGGATTREEWTSTPVFWFELDPEGWSYGLGYYMARPATMAKLRARIDKAPAKFEKLVAPLLARGEFVLDGPEYARRKQAPTEATALWYNKKGFSLIHQQEIGAEVFSAELAERVAAGYAFLMPLYDYLITLDADPTPVG